MTFLLLALCNALVIVAAGVFPAATTDCDATGCHWAQRTERLLSDDERPPVVATPVATRQFAAHVARPLVRLGLAGVELVESGPFVLLLAGVGLALRRLGGRAPDPLARALPWLRLASVAAIIWALARPLADSLLAMLLSPGTPGGAHWQLSVDLAEVGIALMLAVAAYATIWALEAGLRAQQDLESFV